jgi:hypothetical protein
MNFLFYSLISEVEGKKRTIKMKGPFTHKKPSEVVDMEYQRYLCSKDEILHEERFLSKKFSNEIPLFLKLEVPISAINSIMACRCGIKVKIPGNVVGKIIKCQKCGEESKISMIDIISFEKVKSDAFIKASDFFEKRFEEIRSNYQICSRY